MDSGMKPTKVATLLAIALGVAVAAHLLVRSWVANGMSTPTAPLSLQITLPSIGLVELILAAPIWRYRNQLRKIAEQKSLPRPKRVDPFYAVQVLLIAKASAIAAAIFAGGYLGVLALQLSLPVIAWPAVIQNVIGLAGALVLAVAALIVERICRIPQDGNGTENGQKAAPGKSEAAPA